MEKRTKDFRSSQGDPAANRRSRKPQKIAKSLNATFSATSEDKLQVISKEFADFSPISDVTDINHIQDIDGSFLQVVDPALSASCESLFFPDLSPSSVVTVEKEERYKPSEIFDGSHDLDEVTSGSVEAEIAVNFFRHALSQVLESTDVDQQSKKLLDVSLRIIVDELLVMPQEQDQIVQLISAKSNLLFLCLLLWIIVLALTFIFGSGINSSFTGPLPT